MKELEKELLREAKDRSCIVLLSGGIDSTTLLFVLKSLNYEIYSLTFNYSGRNFKEIEACRKISSLAKVKKHIEVDLDFLKEITEVEGKFGRNLHEQNYVPYFYIPARNGIFFYIATYYAEILGASRIFTGHTKEDKDRLPDLNDDFIRSLNRSIKKGTLIGKIKGLKIVLPFKNLRKEELTYFILRYNVPIQYTWSCHSASEEPCNNCIGCRERKIIINSIEKKINSLWGVNK